MRPQLNWLRIEALGIETDSMMLPACLRDDEQQGKGWQDMVEQCLPEGWKAQLPGLTDHRRLSGGCPADRHGQRQSGM